MLVTAQVEPVFLEIIPKQLKFLFEDENEEMYAKQKLKIENKGETVK
jgi:hypothetical protein